MIGIITYDRPHRKTQDLISQLIFKGYNNLLVIAIPFIERKTFQPLFSHRPTKAANIMVSEMCDHLGIQYVKTEIAGLQVYLSKFNFEHILIAGAGLVPEEITKEFKIINSHPGYLPNVKGLDALKWAILNGQPIGVTTHYISGNTDEGLLIERQIIPVYFEDTFHSVAFRQYETEIEMLVNSIKLVQIKNVNEKLIDERYKVNTRMPHHLELKMMNNFQRIIEKSPSVRESGI